jgi:SAM-dependent methyltransferase
MSAQEAGGAPDVPWLDQDRPHPPATSRRQLRALQTLLAPAPKRILDLGCGGGRVLVSLAARGHRVVGLDRSERALGRCARALAAKKASADLVLGDFLAAPLPAGPFDAVLCLGNTFLHASDAAAAADLVASIRARLAPGGAFAIDDLPREFWPEVTEGNWLSGITQSGDAQLVWHATDSVFALRHGERVDPDGWDIKHDDVPMRLWTDGALLLLARAAGLSPPRRIEDACLIVLGKG